jgi:hypothetical protein
MLSITAGDQVPLTPLGDVVFNIGGTLPEQIEKEIKPGFVRGFTVTFNV